MRFVRLPRVAFMAGTALLLCACPNPNAYTVPRTLEPGDRQFVVAEDGYGFYGKQPSSSGSTTAARYGATPLLPSIGARFGLLDGLDVGVRLQNFLSLAGDLKIRLLRGRLDLAADPGIEAMYDSTQATVNGADVSQHAGVFYFHAPLLVGLNLSDVVTLVASPGVAYAVSTNPLTLGSAAEQAGDTTAFLVRLGLGVDIRTSEHFAVHPEVTCMKGFTSAETLICVGGLGINVGDLPSYSDLSPAPP